jgi:hypothetical protein
VDGQGDQAEQLAKLVVSASHDDLSEEARQPLKG